MLTKVHIIKAMVFPVVMYRYKNWTIKKAECKRIDAFELWSWIRLLSPLDSKKIKPVNPKENQLWTFIGRTDAETEAPILWLPDVKSRLTGKDPDTLINWGQEDKGVTEDGMGGWHYWLNGQEFERTVGDGEEQGNLVCCSPWGCKELDMTTLLNNNTNIPFFAVSSHLGPHSALSKVPCAIQWVPINYRFSI